MHNAEMQNAEISPLSALCILRSAFRLPFFSSLC